MIDTIFFVVVLYGLVLMCISIFYSQFSNQNITNLFLSGRTLPFWLVGISINASVFSINFPQIITALTFNNGIVGNWMWWGFILPSIFMTFFIAKLWRKTSLHTDLELIEFRYTGMEARIFRGFKSVYFGGFVLVLMMASVHTMFKKLMESFYPSEYMINVFLFISLFIALYLLIGGQYASVIADVIQFIIMLLVIVVLLVEILNQDDLLNQGGFQRIFPEWMFNLFPQIKNQITEPSNFTEISFETFLSFVLLQWSVLFFSQLDIGGGGQIAQKLLSAKNENQAVNGSLFFSILFPLLRTWQWILVALVTLYYFPQFEITSLNHDSLPFLLHHLFNPFVIGVIFVSFLASYISTISSLAQLAASYWVFDFYKRFVVSNKSDRHYVWISKFFLSMVLGVSLWISLEYNPILTSIIEIILCCSASSGFVLIMRWFWWRINIWTEIFSFAIPYVLYPFLKYFLFIPQTRALLYTAMINTFVAIIVTYMMKTKLSEHLKSFYMKMKIGGFLWRRYRKSFSEITVEKGYFFLLFNCILASVFMYCFLLGIGRIIFEQYLSGIVLILVGITSAMFLYLDFDRKGWTNIT